MTSSLQGIIVAVIMGVRSSHSTDVDSKGVELVLRKQLGLIPLGNFYATATTLHTVTICTILHYFIAIMEFSARLVIFIIIFRRKKKRELTRIRTMKAFVSHDQGNYN